ncbi:phosphoribosylanthranilate isomerase [Natroniella sulfidigena]|uniref:phosphoribosylanthranilate isomerase n=1 Tax=Natroniella sulfidigena TaxID=723921 RepID=UPI00200AA194|nr:phosphoribosylanthranilate isomerase [Natroniella sulfidigena]MCK8815757.1 phosphoribosylanthranilate isomerase [Natroniella sulfidigena]
MTQIKICGLTNLEDAQLASQLGADLLGFIFADSPRQVTVQQVQEIISKLNEQVKTVGVFANQSLEEVNQIAEACQLDYLQLHGDESPSYCQQLELPVIKAFRVKDRSYLEELAQYDVAKFLLDTYHPDKLGGSGQTFNWELALAAKEYGEVIIAGGLDETNVKQAIEAVQPAGVDVSSGVEAKPGVKDHDKLKRFIRAIDNLQCTVKN